MHDHITSLLFFSLINFYLSSNTLCLVTSFKLSVTILYNCLVEHLQMYKQFTFSQSLSSKDAFSRTVLSSMKLLVVAITTYLDNSIVRPISNTLNSVSYTFLTEFEGYLK